MAGSHPRVALEITQVVRVGSSARVVSPSTPYGPVVYVGDRLIGRYIAPPGRSSQLRIRARVERDQPLAESLADARERLDVPHEGRDGTADASATAADPNTRAPEPFGEWELDTTHMRPRAYTLSLALSDLGIALTGSTEPPTGAGRESVSLDFYLFPRPTPPRLR